MSLIEQVEREIVQNSLLKHPFYQMWSKGELDKIQISGYAKEYFQLVKVVPEFLQEIRSKAQDDDAKRIIELHCGEEEQHIELWCKFASALGIPRSELEAYMGSPKTREAVSSLIQLIRNSTFEEAVSALYSYEWELPKISRSKLDGLAKYYGMTSPDATVYFETHLEADVRHAATWKQFLNSIEEGANVGDPLKTAIKSINAQNRLLDSVMEYYVQ